MLQSSLHKTALLSCLFVLITSSMCSQDQLIPKREFRGVWVATVKNIDYPDRPTANATALQEQWRLLLRKFKETGINAVIMQIRPASDAFYPSKLAPWSRFLTGKEGEAPIPYFDPLEFMIEETHQQGMEFHAWLNPYRATTDLDTAILASNHIFYQHPEWIIKYGKRYYLNPALPEVRDHLAEIVSEIVTNYKVDAIHFDDYFYPYKVKGESFPDSLEYQTLGPQFDNIGDWRRHNVDQLIQQVGTQIKAVKPYIKFGISPFGVWRNVEDDPGGSKTRAGATCYDDLYADVLKWMRRDWIDYVAPQLYWHIGYEPADHAILLDWWSARARNTQLYIGHAVYKVADNKEEAWHLPSEIPLQVSRARLNFNTQGSIFYNTNTLLKNRLGVRDSLRQQFAYPALVPEFTPSEVSIKRHDSPRHYKVRSRKGGVRIKWRPSRTDKNTPPKYYVVYRFDGPQVGNYEDPRNILAVTPFWEDERTFKYYDYSTKANKVYTYAIKPVNELNQEGKVSDIHTIRRKRKGLKRLK
ncbi:MAG: family 10 glycosylhydrolase [Bacteroidota bacterium]